MCQSMMTNRYVLVILSILPQCAHSALPIGLQSQTHEAGDSRLLHQMLQLFTPTQVTTPNPMIPPYGINAKKPVSADLVENQNAIRNGAQMAMNPWAKVAEEVIGMFGTKPSTTPPSPPSTFPPILPSEFTRFLGNYNLFPRTQGLPINEFANSIPSTLQGDRPANFIDTGGQSFDRFVIHENQEGDNLLGLGSNLMGRWNERGLQWSNGNLRLVNMRGNNLLGSQVAVHDRSVDIPVQQWLDMASNLFDTYRGP